MTSDRCEGDGQWHLTTHTRDDAHVDLPAHGGSISLSDIYADVDLEEGRPSQSL